MILYRPARLATLLTATLLLAACGGGKGSSASPPTGVQVKVGDQAVTVSWDAQPGVQYWVFIGPKGTTPDNFSSISGAFPAANVGSPYGIFDGIINGAAVALVNGRSYDVTINARTNGGPGGPSTTPVTVTPRATATVWQQQGSPLLGAVDGAADDVLGAAWGTPLYQGSNGLAATGNPADFVFVGRNGSAWYTTLNADGQNYTTHAVASNVPTGNDLTGLAYSGGLGFLAAGTNGQASLSFDGITWVHQATATTRNFRALSTTGSGGYIAVGDGCMVYAVGGGGSGQTTNWVDYTAGFTSASAFAAACAGANPPSLHAARYPGTGNYYLAGGSQGVLAFSPNYGSTSAAWWAATPTLPSGAVAASVNINALYYGVVNETQPDGTSVGVPLWLAAGDYTDAGNVVRPLILSITTGPTLSNGVYTWSTWTPATLPAGLTGSLRALSAAQDPVNGGLTQLVAAGDNGMLLYDQLSVPRADANGNISAYIAGTPTPGQTWVSGTNPAGGTVYAIAHGNFGMQAGGAAGTRLFTY